MADLDAQRKELSQSLGSVGAWVFALDRQPYVVECEFAQLLEELGYETLWIPEGLGSKEVLSHAALLLSATERLIIATGIANIWARDAYAMTNGARALAEAFPGRFVLGIGASHSSSVEMRGHAYARPFSHMVEYLDGMDAAKYAGPKPERPAPVVLAALGPRMLRLAAERTAGVHTYFVPVEHSASARETLGEDPLLLPEQAAVLETDSEAARRIARKYMSGYMDLPNYLNNLRRLGWSDEDLAGGGSDALVDSIVVWGDAERIRARVREHLDAGADHVCVQILGANSRELPSDGYRELAQVVLE